MRNSPFLRSCSVFVLLAGLACASSAQTLKILSAGAFKQVALAFVPDFEARTGVKVVIDNDTAGGLVRRIQGGEPFDLVIAPPSGLDTLAKAGRIDPASVRPVARVGIGVAVKAGAPRPALDTVEQFKDAVLRARMVAYIDPASGGSSGIYLDGLFQRLGIADAVRVKAVLVAGGLVAERVANGEADLAIHQVSEILPVQGAELVGLLPDSIQNYTTYAVARSGSGAMAQAARQFADALAAPEAAAMLRAKGMLPAPAEGASAGAQEPARPSQYRIRQVDPDTGSNVRRNIVTGSGIPFDKTYGQLTPQEQDLLKSQYEHMGPGDEPPFPTRGLGPLYTAMAAAQQKLHARGTLSMAVEIDTQGQASSVSVLQSPDPAMTRAAATILMLETYKPALCGGTPCRMQFPFRLEMVRR